MAIKNILRVSMMRVCITFIMYMSVYIYIYSGVCCFCYVVVRCIVRVILRNGDWGSHHLAKGFLSQIVSSFHKKGILYS